jgi:hypothetical protein
MIRPYYPDSRIARKQYRGQAAILRLLAGGVLASVLGLAMLASNVAHAQGNNPIARFEGGIGSQPLRAVAPGVPATNDVNGTPPGGRPWVIDKLSAQATTDRIHVQGQGLLLGGGATVGTPGGQSVRARLFCDGLPHDSQDLVPLDPQGDFRIDSPFLGNPPPVCNNPVLLIINANGSWFAAGIPKR